MFKKYFDSYVANLKSTLDELDYNAFEKVIKVLLQARKQDRQIFIIGNGGSASAASHFACDLAKGTINPANPLFKRFRAASLTDNMALITAIGNDCSYAEIFVEQLKNVLNPGDVVIVITGSGNSVNIIKALHYARSVKATNIGLLGFQGGEAVQLVDYSLTASTRNYGIAEDFHIIVEHMLTQIIKRLLQPELQKVVFLDRDGVINVKAAEHSYITTWQDFEFMPGIFDALKYLNDTGYKLIVLTNQQGLGKQIFSEQSLLQIHENMSNELKKNGVTVDRIFYCPHTEADNCNCRKPKPGMFYKAMNEADYNIDFEKSYVLGDSLGDLPAGRALGCKTIYFGNQARISGPVQPDYIIQDLKEILNIL